MDLTFSEQLAVEQIMQQSDGQLTYTINQLSQGAEFDFVDFLIIPQNRIAMPVKKTFFLDALLHEMEYREGEGDMEV